jgi:hypothetical protein
MIQRVQSIFLFFIVVAMITLLFVPIWEERPAQGGENLEMNAFNLKTVEVTAPAANSTTTTEMSKKDTFYIAILAIAAAMVAGYEIFRYDNRLMQMKIGALNSLVMVGVMVAIMVMVNKAEDINPATSGQYRLGTFLVIGALVCNLIANRFIRRDERLVRSADRIR